MVTCLQSGAPPGTGPAGRLTSCAQTPTHEYVVPRSMPMQAPAPEEAAAAMSRVAVCLKEFRECPWTSAPSFFRLQGWAELQSLRFARSKHAATLRHALCSDGDSTRIVAGVRVAPVTSSFVFCAQQTNGAARQARSTHSSHDQATLACSGRSGSGGLCAILSGVEGGATGGSPLCGRGGAWRRTRSCSLEAVRRRPCHRAPHLVLRAGLTPSQGR